MNIHRNRVITGWILILSLVCIMAGPASGSPGMPDLTPTGLEFTPSFGDINSQVQISSSIVNKGDGGASGFYVYYYLSKDLGIDPSDTYLGYNYIFSVGPGETLINRAVLTIPAEVIFGSYYIGAIIDPPGWVIESDKTDNTGVSPEPFLVGSGIPVQTDTIEPYPAPTPKWVSEPTPDTIKEPVLLSEGPDIVLDKMGVPEQVNAGDIFRVKTLLLNRGNEPAGGFYISYYLSGSRLITPQDLYLGYSFIAPYFSIPPASQYEINYTARIPASVQPGTYYFAAVADATHVFGTDNPDDNVGGVPITIIETAPAEIPVTTKDVTGSLTVSSIPNGARITLNKEQFGLSPSTIGRLVPGTYTIRLEKAGYEPYEGSVEVVTGRTVILTIRLTRIETAISPQPVTPKPTPVPGAIMIGSTPLGAMVFLGENALGVTPYTITGLLPGQYHISLRAAGYDIWEENVSVESYRISQVNAPLKPGTAQFGLIPADTNLTDTQTDITVPTVSPKPTPGCENGVDLIVLSVDSEEKQVKRDSIFRARATVANAGNVDAGPFFVAYYLSKDNVTETEDAFIGSHYYYQLGAGIIGSYIDRMTVSEKIVPGEYYLGAVVDYTGLANECQEDNNSFTSDIPIVVI
ncbi:MAG: PEGA domain-containing protein [Methanospirillaceae archaeon]|nr:PEGA domain-containing protein [Methanospirillaceae archaeon]